MEKKEKVTVGHYLSLLTTLLREPRRFFLELSEDVGIKGPFVFLLVSSLLNAVAGVVSNMSPRPVTLGAIFLLNSLGMTLITAGFGYMAMIMTMGRRVTFSRFFSIYAFSCGVTLLASWMPFFFWITEPWKYWLIGTGMVQGFGFRWFQAAMIIFFSIAITILLFWSVLPMVLTTK